MGGSLKTAYESIIEAGYQVSPEAFSLLESSKSPELVARRLISMLEAVPEKPLIIEGHHLEGMLEAVRPTGRLGPASSQLAEPQKMVILSGEEVIQIEGAVADFKAHFTNRFEALERILRSRADLRDATGVSSVVENGKWRKVKVIGMVTSKRDFKTGSTLVVLEDTLGSAEVIFKPHLKEKTSRLLIDEVVCILGNTKNGRSIVAEDAIWPEFSPRTRSSGRGGEGYVVMTSDIHIGSKLFLKDNFESFINWLRGQNGEGPSKEIAAKTRYLIIAGDLVDGVGVYPNQEEELSIRDLNRQYQEAAEYLALVPEEIKIIIIPGNHDACRPTLPTPPIYRDYAAPVYDLKNVTMLGDPALVNLEGYIFLLTHGRSLDDVIPALPNCSFKEPQKAMVELLRSRHLAPIYGEKTPLAPEYPDRLVIETVPDVFHAGHVHTWGVTEYRGVIVANTGTWQAQTNYQLSMGIEPQPGVVTVVNLANFRPTTMKFI